MSVGGRGSLFPPFLSPVPRHLAYDTVPVEVWQEQAEGHFAEVSDRMVCDRVEWRSDSQIDRARFHYVLAENEPPMVQPGSTTFRRDYLSAAWEQIDPNRLLRVLLGSTDRDQVRCLMEGYPQTDTLSWGRNPRDHAEGISFQVVGAMDRWKHDTEAQVIGRFVHGGFALAGDPDSAIDRSLGNVREVMSAPCIFNEGGRPNCSPFPIQLQLDLVGDGPQDVPLYIFAAPGEREQYSDPNTSRPVEYWSYARALFYLIYMYGVQTYEGVWQPQPIGLPGTWIQKLLTENILQSEPTPAPFGTALAKAMWGRPNGLETNNTSLFDALGMVCADAGCHFHVTYDVDGDRSVQPQLHLWMEGVDADMREPPLAVVATRQTPRTSPPRSPYVTMLLNRAMQTRVTEDTQPVINMPFVVGGRRLYEATFDLVPGWVPLFRLDNVPATQTDVDAARQQWRPLGAGSVESAGSVGQYRRSDERHDDFRDIGRKWVLNEAGTYFATGVEPDDFLYARQDQPPLVAAFGVSAYRPFSPAAVDLRRLQIDDRDPAGSPIWVGINANDWALRPRPFGSLVRTEPVLREEAPVCDISFDGGVNWQATNDFEVLATEAAIRFIPESPLDVTPLDPATGQPQPWWDDNMWYAIIEDRFRVRVTATVEGDDLLVPGWRTFAGSTKGPITRLRTRIIDRPDYEVVTRHDSKFRTGAQPAQAEIVHQDLTAAESYREELRQVLEDRQIAGSYQEPYIDAVPSIGQQVPGIFNVLDFSRLSGVLPRAPQVVGVDWQLSGAQSTTVIMGDLRHVREPALT